MSVTLNEQHPIYDDVIVEVGDRLITAEDIEAIAARPRWDTQRVVASTRREGGA